MVQSSRAKHDGVGKTTFAESLQALRTRGRMVLYGSASGRVEPFDPALLGERSLSLSRPGGRDYMTSRSELLGRADDLFTWIREGRLDVRIGSRYSLDQGKRA